MRSERLYRLICYLVDGDLNETISNSKVGIVGSKDYDQTLVGFSVWVGVAKNAEGAIPKVTCSIYLPFLYINI